MNINMIIDSGIAEFKNIFTNNYKKLNFSDLTPDFYLQFSECLKNAVNKMGQQMIIDFLKSYEIDNEVITVNEQPLRLKTKSEKEFLTFFGHIKLERNIYQNDRGGSCYVPLDSKWGVKNEFAAPDVQEAILFSSAFMIPSESKSLFDKCALFNPSTTAIQNVVNKSNNVISDNEEEMYQVIQSTESVPEKTDILVSSLDGANVLLREKGKRKGAKSKRPVDDKKLDEQKTCYKNAMVGTISFYEQRKPEEKHPNRLQTRYFSKMPEEKALSFKNEYKNMLGNTLKIAPHKVQKLLLLDGARGLWSFVNNSEIFNDFEKGIDFFHTTEHLSKAAEALFGKNSSKGKTWYNKYREKLLQEKSGPNSIIRSIEYYSEKKSYGKEKSKIIKTELTFFRRNADKMKYKEFLDKGWPIGSGPVEAACKSIVKTRLCRSGMRWSRKGGQAILNLRTIVKSDRWNSFWNYYQEIKMAA